MSQAELQKILAMFASVPAPSTASVEARREAMAYFNEGFATAPGTVFEKANVGNVPGLWVIPADAIEDRVLLYLHGGAYFLGCSETYRALSSNIAKATKARTLTLDYRLAPEHPFPAAVDDALATYRALLGSGISPQGIAVAGDSAGGGLSMALLLAAKQAGLPMPAAVALLSPWVDLEHRGDSWATKAMLDPWLGSGEPTRSGAAYYLNGGNPAHPLASPLNGDHRDLPPILIQVGTHECLLDDSTRLAARLSAADVRVTLDVWPQMLHVWHVFAERLSEARDAITEIGCFLDRHLPSA